MTDLSPDRPWEQPPTPNTNQPGPVPQQPAGPQRASLGCLPWVLGLIGAAMIVGFIAYTVGPGDDPEKVCNQSAAEYLGIDPVNMNVTENLETPGGSIDIRGSYPGGTYACGLGREPFKLYQTIIYKDDGTAETAFNG